MFEHFGGKNKEHQSLFARAMMLIIAEKDLWDEFGADKTGQLMQWI